MKNKKLFYDCTILTMDKDLNVYNSVYVEDGIIKDLGDYDDLKKRYSDCEGIDLNGYTMTPGFIEPHAHFDLCSICSQMISVSGIDFPNTEDVLEQIKKAVKTTPKGRFIMGFGIDYLINRDLPEIDRYYLDAISCEHPIALIIQSMHTMYCNSLALKRCGITRDTKDTRDGHLIKDKDGEPLGIMTEQGFILPMVKLWLSDLNMKPEDLLNEEAKRWAKLGVTTTWTAGYTPVFNKHFITMTDFFNLESTPLRGDYAMSYNSIEGGHVSEDDLLAQQTIKSKMTGIKSWYDGSPYTGNMFMYDNYLENDIMQKKLYIPAFNKGERLFEPEMYYKMIKKYHDMGYQLSIHAQGNRAAHEVLLILNRVLEESPRKDHRHRIEHCAFIQPGDLKLAHDLGVTLSFHINHIYYYGEALRELVVGKKLADGMLLCKSALNLGIKISLHSDAPMYSPNMLRVMGGAITRKTRDGLVMNEAEALSVTEALRAITIDAAWQLFRENEIGSIEIGKLADFTIIKENPYKCDKDHIKDIEVIKTYIGGKDTSLMFK